MEDQNNTREESLVEPAELGGQAAEAPKGKQTRLGAAPLPRHHLFLCYVVAILAVVAATFLRSGLDPILRHRAPFATYYVAIMFVAWYARLGPSLVAILFSAALATHFFIKPHGSLLSYDLEHQVSLGLFFAVGAFTAILSESLHRDVAKRKRAEEALREHTVLLGRFAAQLDRANSQLQREKQHLKTLMELQDRERQLIGFEIHDGLVQLLTGAKMQLESFKQLESQHPLAAKEALESGIQALANGIKEARGLINGLRLPSLDAAGVVGAIEDLIQEIRREPSKVELVVNVAFQRLPGPLENTIFRVVQESLGNACRHSKSERVRVELRQEDNRLRIEVQDWGIGFDPQKVGNDRFGVEGIRERARMFGGQATIESCPGKGTRVVVEFPLPSDEEAYRSFPPCPCI